MPIERWVVLAIIAGGFGCAGGLAAHLAAIREPAVRDEVVSALGELERLRQDGWIGRIARGERERDGAALGAHAPSPSETATYRDALDALDRLHATRARLERERNEAGVLDAFRRAVRPEAVLSDECPTDGAALVPIAAAVARHLHELSASGPEVLEVSGAASRCRVATLYGSILVGAEVPRREGQGARVGPRARIESVLVLRGEAVHGAERADMRARSSTTAPEMDSFDFAGAPTFVVAPESGPWSHVPAVQVELWSGGGRSGVILGFLVVRASDGWRVIETVHVGDV